MYVHMYVYAQGGRQRGYQSGYQPSRGDKASQSQAAVLPGGSAAGRKRTLGSALAISRIDSCILHA